MTQPPRPGPSLAEMTAAFSAAADRANHALVAQAAAINRAMQPITAQLQAARRQMEQRIILIGRDSMRWTPGPDTADRSHP